MRHVAGDLVEVHSAGTDPGQQINALSAQVLAERGVDVSDRSPALIDPELAARVDLVVTLGRGAHVSAGPDRGPRLGHRRAFRTRDRRDRAHAARR